MADEGALDQVEQVSFGLDDGAVRKGFKQQPLQLLRVLAPGKVCICCTAGNMVNIDRQPACW